MKMKMGPDYPPKKAKDERRQEANRQALNEMPILESRLRGMYPEGVPPDIDREQQNWEVAVQEAIHGEDPDALETAVDGLHAFMQKQWETTGAARTGALTYEDWSSRYDAFARDHDADLGEAHGLFKEDQWEEAKKQFGEFKEAYFKALNAGDEAGMQEVSKQEKDYLAAAYSAVDQFAEPEATLHEEGVETEATLAENRGKLQEAVEDFIREIKSAPEKKEGGKEGMSERGARLRMNLMNRSAELNAEVAEMSKLEKYFRKMGETYNKAGLKTKIGVGLALGIGVGVGSAVSVPAAIACMSGIAAQRIAGLSSMYLKFEKTSKSKERAMGKAIAWTAGMTGAMLLLSEGVKEGVEYAQQHNWLERIWPFDHHVAPSGAPKAPEHSVVGPAHTAEVSGPAPVAHAEMPSVSVGASRGHGYEYMMKRLWEQLQDKHLNPSQYAENSDIHKLLTADANSIDKVVHQIASDPNHGFYNADGSSVVISPHDHLSIGADGQVHISDSVPGAPVHAPAEAPMTPASQQEAHVISEGSGQGSWESSSGSSPTGAASLDHVASTAHHAGVPTPEPSHFNGPAVSPHEGLPAFTVNHDIATTAFGLDVPLKEPHLYSGWNNGEIFAYGGTPTGRAQAILEYLKTHANGVIHAPSDDGKLSLAWRLVNGELTPSPVRHGGFFGFFRSFVKAPDPSSLQKLIK